MTERDRGEVVATRRVYQGRVVDLRLETVRLPGDAEVELEVVRHRGAAAVVPLLDDGDVLLVRQFRASADREWLLEVPAGKLDDGEAPESCARRETEEEVGFAPGRLDPLGRIYTSPGFTDEKIWLFLARDLERSEQELEEDEVLEVERMPFPEAVRLAVTDGMADAKSICALLRAAAWLEAEGRR